MRVLQISQQCPEPCCSIVSPGWPNDLERIILGCDVDPPCRSVGCKMILKSSFQAAARCDVDHAYLRVSWL